MFAKISFSSTSLVDITVFVVSFLENVVLYCAVHGGPPFFSR